MEVKDAIARAEKIHSLLLAVEELKEGRWVMAVKLLRPLTGLTIPELSKSITIARGEELQGEASEEAREVGLLLKKVFVKAPNPLTKGVRCERMVSVLKKLDAGLSHLTKRRCDRV